MSDFKRWRKNVLRAWRYRRQLGVATHALRQIAFMPTSERNPDGDEQAAHSMQVVALTALSEVKGPGRCDS